MTVLIKTLWRWPWYAGPLVLLGAFSGSGMAQDGIQAVQLAAPHTGASADEQQPTEAVKLQARRARDQRRPELAVSLYKQLLKSDSGADVSAGLSMALAEAGRHDEALTVLGAASAAAQPPLAALAIARATAYVLMLGPDWVKALDHVTVARTQFAHDEELQRSQLDILLRLGAPHRAEALTPTDRTPNPQQQLHMELHQAALLLRWANAAPAYAEPHVFTDRALALNAHTANKHPGAPEVANDRVQMLAQRGWSEQAIALGSERSDAAWPAYTRAALADVHLRLRQPERAAVLYQSALKDTDKPWPIDWQVGLVYALLEANRYDECRQALQVLVDGVPATRIGLAGTRVNNPDHPNVGVFSARIHAYLEDTRAARQQLDTWAEKAPFSGAVRRAAGDIALITGQPREAAGIYQRLNVDDPKDSGPVLGLAHAAMAVGQYPQARARLDQVREAGDAQEQEAKLRRKLEDEQRPYWVWDMASGRESALSVDTSRELGSTARLYSSVQGQRRVFAQHLYQRAFEERSQRIGLHQALGLGLQWRDAMGRAELGLSASTTHDKRVGTFGAVAWTPDDQWTAEARWDTNSTSTPLRARHDGVHGQRFDLALTHRRDDDTRWAVNSSLGVLSDGNRRMGFGATWNQQWLRTPTYTLSTQFGGALGRNSAIETARYFNPLNDRSVWLYGQQQWAVYRRYERAVMVRLGLSVGRYNQHGIGAGQTWGASLEGEWRIDSGAAVSVGFAHDVRPYDGVSHQQNKFLLRMEWRQ